MTRTDPRIRLTDPILTPFGQWLPANHGFYSSFRRWLKEGGYSRRSLKVYSAGARVVLGFLDKPYWLIALPQDLERARQHLSDTYAPSTRELYAKGVAKLEAYLHLRCRRPKPVYEPNWAHHVGPLPEWLADDVRAFVAHRQRSWVPERRRKATNSLLSHLTLYLRWAAQTTTLSTLADLTPVLWFDYLDQRLASGISPVTLNGQLTELHHLLHFLAEQGRSVSKRMLKVEGLPEPRRLPRDVPLSHVRQILAAVEEAAASSHARERRRGVMDRAWVHLMLHCGLRTCEVRRLNLADVDLEGPRVRIDQSKGLQDRLVPLSRATADALTTYLPARDPTDTDYVFLCRHEPLSPTYCWARLRTYGERCGVKVTPHQLRHTCATLLLNAGAPILTVQAILGHRHIDTTLGYARLYDGTVAAHYSAAMEDVERSLTVGGDVVMGGNELGRLAAE